MTVKLLTGKKAGKIADVTNDHGRDLVAAGLAIEVGVSGEIWPEKEEKQAEPLIVVQPIIIEQEKEMKPRKRKSTNSNK